MTVVIHMEEKKCKIKRRRTGTAHTSPIWKVPWLEAAAVSVRPWKLSLSTARAATTRLAPDNISVPVDDNRPSADIRSAAATSLHSKGKAYR